MGFRPLVGRLVATCHLASRFESLFVGVVGANGIGVPQAPREAERIEITQPSDGTEYLSPFSDTMVLTVDPSHVVEPAQYVRFYSGTNVIHEDTNSPYTCVLNQFNIAPTTNYHPHPLTQSLSSSCAAWLLHVQAHEHACSCACARALS